jgi:glycosyltransferase involved in cell wall biosynthesis
VIAEGPLAGEEASRRMSAADIYLAPFVDGVSSRRGSFIAGLQHGIASVATIGENSDPFLRESAGKAFLAADVNDCEQFSAQVKRLAADVNLRANLGPVGQRLFNEWFAWPTIARRVRGVLADAK